MSQWALLSGERGSGRSLHAQEIARRLSASGVRVGGFVQEPVHEGEQKVGYRLRRVGQEEHTLLGRRGDRPGPGQEQFCSFLFEPQAFTRALQWLEEDLATADVIVLDEVSKLEAQGQGHAAALARVLESGKLTLLSVRADQLFAVMERFGLEAPVADLCVSELQGLEAFVSTVAASVRAR